MFSAYFFVADRLERAEWIIPTLSRFVFAASLLMYFWASGLTKLGEGLLGILQPSVGAYAQIFPMLMESISYDITQLSMWHWAVVTGGTIAEFVLPTMIVLGLFTRLASLGMVGFVIIQTLTDLIGHGGLEHPKTFGAWFDRFPDSAILDQRLFWIAILLTLVIKGAGPLSIDHMLLRRTSRHSTPSESRVSAPQPR